MEEKYQSQDITQELKKIFNFILSDKEETNRKISEMEKKIEEIHEMAVSVVYGK